MGKIHGDVRVVGIANLLQALSINRCLGTLSVTRGDQRKVLHFSEAGIRMVGGARRTNPLGEILLRSGKITILQLHEYLAEQRRTGQPLGRIVVERGVLAQADLDQALREQVAEEIYDLFGWGDAAFEFAADQPGTAPPGEGLLSTVTLDSNLMSLSMEAARRSDEIGRIHAVIPDESCLVEKRVPTAAIDDPGVDKGVVDRILSVIDGKRSVGDIIRESFYPPFTVLRTLYGLAQRGIVGFRDRAGGRDLSVPAAAEKPPAAAPRGRTILVVSQLPQFRAALAHCLRQGGYAAVEEGFHARLIDTAVQGKVDAVVLDMSLETEDALGLLSARPDTASLPLIVLADNSSAAAITKAVKAGARHVLVKPVMEQLLLDRVGEVLPSPTGV